MDRPRKWMALERAAHAPPPEGRSRPRGVGRRGGRLEASGAIPGGAAPGADLGGSSDRSDENSEGRSGEGFRANGVRTRVSRPRGKGRFRKGRRRDRPEGGSARGPLPDAEVAPPAEREPGQHPRTGTRKDRAATRTNPGTSTGVPERVLCPLRRRVAPPWRSVRPETGRGGRRSVPASGTSGAPPPALENPGESRSRARPYPQPQRVSEVSSLWPAGRRR